MNKNTILASALLAGLVTTGTLAYAADAVTTSKTGTTTQFSQMRGHRGSGMGNDRGGFMQLTDAEQTSLQSMTDTEKQAFFEKKRAEAQTARAAEQAKREAHEAVIDKLINGEALTDAEKATLAEIKTERAAAKAQRADMQAKREAAEKARTALQPILEKVKNKQTLTADEQKQLYDAQSSDDGLGLGFSMGGKSRGEHGRGGEGRGFGSRMGSDQDTSPTTIN